MVDLADPQDVLAKLSEAEQRLEELAGELARWVRLVEQLRVLTGSVEQPEPPAEQTPASANGSSPQGIQDLVVREVERAMQPIRARDVTAILLNHNHDVNAQSVANALWHADKAGRIQRVAHGSYAPLNYKPPGPSLEDVAVAGAGGLAIGALAAATVEAAKGLR